MWMCKYILNQCVQHGKRKYVILLFPEFYKFMRLNNGNVFNWAEQIIVGFVWLKEHVQRPGKSRPFATAGLRLLMHVIA